MSKVLSCSEVWGGNSRVDTAFQVPGLNGALFSRPASGPRGGDIYLVSTCDQGQVAKVVLADVSGHGERVARVGQLLAALLRDNLSERDNDRFLTQLNQQFSVESATEVTFATLVCATFVSLSRQLSFAYAGHPPIVLGRRGRFSALEAPPAGPNRLADLPIGVVRDAAFHQGRQHLEPGDWLILFSDGLIEAANDRGQHYGMTRLIGDLGRLATTSPMVVKNGLLTRLSDFVLPRRLDQDDLTLMVMETLPPPPPPVSEMAPELRRLLKQPGEKGKP